MDNKVSFFHSCNAQTSTQQYKNYSLYHTCTDVKVNEMIKEMIENEKIGFNLDKENALKETLNDNLTCWFYEEPNWEEKERHYLVIEKWLNKSPEIPSNAPTGSLHYGMSLEEMQEAITDKFKDMASTGHVKKQSDLKGQENKYFSHSSDDLTTGSNNLTRIWGAQFLKEELKGNEDTLNVADHFLIVEDGATSLEITVLDNKRFPSIWRVDNGYVLSQRITGRPSAKDYWEHKALKKTGFHDFSDPGNILKDENGVGWIVDTESKGLRSPCNMIDFLTIKITDYLEKRFNYLNQNVGHLIKFNIPISGIFN